MYLDQELNPQHFGTRDDAPVSRANWTGLVFNLLRGIHTVFIVAARICQFTFPSIVHRESLFFTSLLTLVISCLFDNNYSDRCEMTSHCGFDCIFLVIGDVEPLFGHLYVFFGNMSIQILCPL